MISARTLDGTACPTASLFSMVRPYLKNIALIGYEYKDAIASDEKLNEFLVELPTQIKVSVGEALAMLETQDNVVATEEGAQQESEEKATDEDANNTDNAGVTKTSGKVMATTNVNVRNAAKQTADAIGVAQGGTEYTLIENLGEWLCGKALF